MTAPTRGGADEIREQVAAALRRQLGRDWRDDAGHTPGSLTGALLPTVQALIAKGVAAELEAAAMHRPTPLNYPAHLLRRASSLRAALDPTPTGGTP